MLALDHRQTADLVLEEHLGRDPEPLVGLDGLDLGRHDLADLPPAQDLLLHRERQKLLGAERAAGEIALRPLAYHSIRGVRQPAVARA